MGFEQAKKTSEKISEERVDLIYCSQLTRAKQTCEEYLKFNPDAEVVYDKNLNEIYRKIIGWPEKEGTSPDREKNDIERIEKFLEKLLDSDKNILVFAHGNVIRYILGKIGNYELKKLWKDMEINPGSISVIENNEIKAINECGHLEEKGDKSYVD